MQAVDMCAACIATHRDKMLPIKAIHLLPRMYDQFKDWTQKNLNRELAEGEKISFDDVYIEKGTASQSTPLLIEMWVDEKETKAFLENHFKVKMGVA